MSGACTTHDAAALRQLLKDIWYSTAARHLPLDLRLRVREAVVVRVKPCGCSPGGCAIEDGDELVDGYVCRNGGKP